MVENLFEQFNYLIPYKVQFLHKLVCYSVLFGGQIILIPEPKPGCNFVS